MLFRVMVPSDLSKPVISGHELGPTDIIETSMLNRDLLCFHTHMN